MIGLLLLKINVMGISRKQIKKAIHRLRVDGKTPHDVIDFINKKLCTNKVEFEEIQNCGDNKILLPTSTILSDVSNLKGIMNGITSVSYTHLTLPTIA